VAIPAPRGVRQIGVKSALDMRTAVFGEISSADVFISVAAVADYRPVAAAEHKIKKSGAEMVLTLTPNPDILADVAALENAPFCVGFAAESRNLDEYAESKRRAKRLPLLVGNLVQDGLGGEDNQVILFDDAGSHPLQRASKTELAIQIVAHIAAMLEAN